MRLRKITVALEFGQANTNSIDANAEMLGHLLRTAAAQIHRIQAEEKSGLLFVESRQFFEPFEIFSRNRDCHLSIHTAPSG